MNIIELDRAISEIRQAWEDVGEDPRRSPFFFIVGAGISSPSVKLATTIMEECERKARQYQRVGTPNGDRPLDQYSFWFSLAYPHARQRQKYFRELIDKKPISLANLRLAHLLSARKLTNLVVTPNFDDFLIKALRLFGQTPAVCDHPSTVARIDVDRDDIQIVYAHGNYLFYDLANLHGEVTGRAQLDRDTSLTMMGLLDNVLWTRSPIVVGYSGWEGDVIMSALKRRLRGGQPLGQSIYWCCYKRDVPSQMPDWLRNSSDVQFVVPPEKPAAVEQPVTSRASDEPARIAASVTPDTTPVLTAREVFEKLGQALHAGDPPLLADPLTFLADQLAAALPKDESAEGGSDPYGFKRLIEKIRAAAGQQAQPERELIRKLEAVTTCIRRSRYPDAVRAATLIVPQRLHELTAEQRKDLLNGVALAGDALLAQATIEPSLTRPLAQVLSVDIDREEHFGALPGGMAILFPSRADQMSVESQSSGRPRGAFSLALERALQRAASAHRRASLHDILIDAGTELLQEHTRQCPVLVGHGRDISLFGSRHSGAGKTGRGKLIALLVGIDHYKKGIPSLGGCVNDVNAFARLFRSHRGMFGEPSIVRVTDRLATAARIRKELERLAETTRPDDVLLFGFSGHMVASSDRGADGNAPRATLVAHDFDGSKGAVSLSDVVQILGRSKAKYRIVILH